MLYKIYEDSNLSSLSCPIRENVSFKGICIRITGTNESTEAELEDVGLIQYVKNGQQMINCNFDWLMALSHMLGGNPKDDSTSSGALRFFVYIPRFFFDDNVEHVTPEDNARISCTFNAGLDTGIASGGKVEVFLDVEDGIQKYDLIINTHAESMAGAATAVMTLEQPNILAIGVSDLVSSVLTTASSAITKYSIAVGGVSHGDAAIGSWVDYTNCVMNLESDYVIATLPFRASGDITSRLKDTANLSIVTSGAAEPQVVVLSAQFDDKRLTRSLDARNARIIERTQSKILSNRADTLAVVKRVAGVTVNK